ncbi:hypothetical protein FDJ57_gp61 [Gordonia phage Sour]|uniref:Uncharacterized protein n=1 Tax=Gordonia phage Sour TaxID=2182349 RepID=A0A2U8UKV6_9CAUD|nr:hypothetical protein FDJ57_gp61 [Gordonia phage Sour]AWN04262.1 hypothetical protein PBI_SOUR_61 [Gordonia phage Sour]
MTITETRAMIDADPAFAALVEQLWRIRQEKAAIQERRKEIYAMLAPRFAKGDIASGHDHVLKQRVVKPRRQPPKVSAAVVKKTRTTLWERSRVPVERVAATAPGRLTIDRAALKLPAVPDRRATLIRIETALEKASYAEHAEREKHAKEVLQRYAVEHLGYVPLGERDNPEDCGDGWSGEPIEFADGWKVGLTAVQFSEERMKQLDPEMWKKLAVSTMSNEVTTYYFTDRTSMDEVETAD